MGSADERNARVADLAEAMAGAIRGGDRRALARGLTLVENESAQGEALLATLGSGGRAHRVGITGPPGAGKSTLVSALTAAWRGAGATVGVLAVDPSSPFTGGALLGDRIRMLAHTADEHVFIRSLASRGALGGLSAGVYDAADLLDAAGFDPVLLETVGVGQGEVEICRAADTTVVVLAPGSGDIVQGMKAGLLEIADVLVINQADREGADALEAALRSAVELRDGTPPPIVTTIATRGEGVEALRALLEARAASDEVLPQRRFERARARLRAAVARRRAAGFWAPRG
ncbi:MAG: methylmalonyl Co-A mutase-associated GTPase MeaB, partial [Planctomycetota bacterium]|nr:methylmalonyl Co-A mutase-associated GTPase MeaB [Planctomycetota bacterium]